VDFLSVEAEGDVLEGADRSALSDSDHDHQAEENGGKLHLKERRGVDCSKRLTVIIKRRIGNLYILQQSLFKTIKCTYFHIKRNMHICFLFIKRA